MWLAEFKIALVEKNTDKLSTLMDEIPEFSNIKDIKQVIYLLEEATNLVEILKDKTEKSMKLMKKNIDYLNSTHQVTPANKLDITL